MNQQNHETEASNAINNEEKPRGEGGYEKKPTPSGSVHSITTRDNTLVADGGRTIDRVLYEELYVTVGFEARRCPRCDEETEHRVEIDHNKKIETLECTVCNHTRECATDGGYDVDLREGDIVHDVGQDTRPPAIVVRVTDVPANRYTIEDDGEKVAVSEYGVNTRYPADAPIVLAVYLSSLDERLIDELEGANERERVRLTRTIKPDQDVPHYGFPSARLDVEDPVDGRDVPDGPLAPEDSSHKYVTDGGQPVLERETAPAGDTRCGADIRPTRVTCPFCPTTAVTEAEVNLCHHCGRWFVVVDPPEVVTDGGRDSATSGDSTWIGPGTWLTNRQSEHKKLGVITDVHERDRDMAARLSIRWYPNVYENISVLLTLERFKSGVWRVSDARPLQIDSGGGRRD